MSGLVLSPTPQFDLRRLRRQWGASAKGFEARADLQRQVGELLVERLDEVRQFAPRTILELGARTPGLGKGLRAKWPGAKLIMMAGEVDTARVARAGSLLPWRRWPALVSDWGALPLANDSCDLVISNLALHWSGHLPTTLGEVKRILRPDGLFLCALGGGATLRELRAALEQWDTARFGRVWPRVIPFPSVNELGEMLVSKGFAWPVVDRELVVLPAPDLRELLVGLKESGAGNPHRSRVAGLHGKGFIPEVEALYRQLAPSSDTTLPVTVEVLFGVGWHQPRSAK